MDRLAHWKIENDCQIGPFAPHLHEYNKAENYIKLLEEIVQLSVNTL